MDRIEEIFVPQSIDTVEGMITFLTEEILRRGGDPGSMKMIDTESAIPNVQHSDEWPCMTFKFDKL